MNWPILILVGAILLTFFVWRRLSFVSADVARQKLAQGALVIDVRSPDEFQTGHVLNAVNVPLGELRADLPHRVKNRNQVLLVHCLSGGRSALAKQQLKSLGYTQVFNLGSLARAKEIVEGAQDS